MNETHNMFESKAERIAKKIANSLLKTLLCGVGLFLILYLSYGYSERFSIFGAIIYFLCFLGIPILLLVLLWKDKAMRWRLFVCVALLLIWLPYSYGFTKVYTNDFSAYLTDDSAFTVNAAEYLPSSEKLSDTQVIAYQEQKTLNGNFKLLQVTVVYSEEAYQAEKERLEKQYQENKEVAFHYDDFYLNGARFYCFSLKDHTVNYAMAYHTCSDERSVTYLFFQEQKGLFSWQAGLELKLRLGYEWVTPIDPSHDEIFE